MFSFLLSIYLYFFYICHIWFLVIISGPKISYSQRAIPIGFCLFTSHGSPYRVPSFRFRWRSYLGGAARVRFVSRSLTPSLPSPPACLSGGERNLLGTAARFLSSVLKHIYIYIKKLPALHGFVAWVVSCTARHYPWQAQNPHCTELHGPGGKATMHGFARKTCKWIPSFTDLHGTAWKMNVHMDPNLKLLMKLNLARPPWQA